jgi:hypothetical protein
MSQALRLYRTLDIHRIEYDSYHEDDRNHIERIDSVRSYDS